MDATSTQSMDINEAGPLATDDRSPQLLQFEDFAWRAIQLGFTIHLTHYRFHPVHTAQCPDVCLSCVQLSIIPILDEVRTRFGLNRDLKAETIGAVLEEGRVLLDRYESGEIFAAVRRKQPNLSPEEREKRSERMRNYWRKKRGEPASQRGSDGDA